MELSDRTDSQLATAAAGGDDEALRRLFERYVHPVHSFTVRLVGSADDADDITQQAFVNAWKHLKRFDPSRKFSTWLFAIAHNEAVNWLKKKRHDAFTPELEMTLADPAARPDELALQSSSARSVESGLARLHPAARTVVSLHHEGLTFREIAASAGQSLHTVKSRYRRALASLREFLKEP